MFFKDQYQRFLVAPKSVPLASDISLSYIPTTTKIEGPDSVLSHFTKQEHIVKRKSEQIIDEVEGNNSLCVDIETTLEFVSGGGAYLPSLDDNFLSDRVATFPTIHIVRFNSQNEIQQIRIYWDQASLLKQVEIIGFRARGWPIRDSKDQTRMIKTAVSSTPAPASAKNQKENEQERSKNVSPGKRYIKDPHAAGSLYELLSPEKDRGEPIRAPRAPASAKPPPREYSELFVGADDQDDDDVPEVGTPSKTKIHPRMGAGKNFQPSRIFDTDETEETHPQIAFRAHPKRFDHFEIGADNSSREAKTVPGRPVSRQNPHWEFDDFATPEKPRRKARGEEIRHFGWSDDEVEATPPVRAHVPKPRRDAETHFQMTDEEEQGGPRIISSFQNKGMGLYKNHLFSGDDHEDDELANQKSTDKGPLSVAANGANRRKDFESSWDVPDEEDGSKSNENKKPAAADRQKAVRMMESSWEATDESPQPRKAVPPPPHRRALRNVNEKSWDLADE